MQAEPSKFPPPPGLITTLVRGFDSVANHVLVILPPVLLDLFLWLGPHLHIQEFLKGFVDALPSSAASLPPGSPDIATIQKATADFASQFNLFMLLRTFPVGLTSLLSFQMPQKSPLGIPTSLDAGSFFGVTGWSLLVILLGWLVGGLYYYWVSRVAIKAESVSLAKTLAQTVFLSIIWIGLAVVFGIPVLMILSVIGLFSPLLSQILLIAAGIALIWLVMPIFFSAHGIYALQLDAFRAILNSLRMIRFTLPNTGLFLLAFVLINQGLNFLWTTPAQNSWWMLVGIAGHAFISTALLAASFIYYRDINAWLAVVFDQLKKQAKSAKI